MKKDPAKEKEELEETHTTQTANDIAKCKSKR